MRPSALTPMTPALAPASTASVNRRRLSIEVARAHDIVVLRAQLLRHVVEGLAELGEIALGAAHRHLDMQVAGRHDIGGADQPADRGHQPVGEIEPDPGRGQQHDQRDDREHQREGDLNAKPARFEIGILADALLRRAQLLDHARIEHLGDIEIHIVVTVQLDGGGDVIALRNERDLRFGLGNFAEQLRRRQHHRLVHHDVGALDRRAVGLDDDRGG